MPARRRRLMALLLMAVALAVSGAHGVAADMPLLEFPRTGLVVYIGEDMDTAVALAKTGRYMVHQLVAASKVETLRKEALVAGVSGRVIVDAAGGGSLKALPDQFVDLLLDQNGDVAAAEVTRLMNVRGVAYSQKGGAWQAIACAPAKGLDDWSHKWHGPSGNVLSQDEKVGPPVTVQWVAGPALGDGAVGGKTPVIAGGLHAVVDSVDGGVPIRSAGSGLLRTRLAVNLATLGEVVLADGQLLCRPQSDAAANRKSGREAGELVAYDANSGEVATKYTDAPTGAVPVGKPSFSYPITLVTADRVVTCAGPELAVLDRKTGKLLWKHTLPEGQWYSPIVAGGLVVACEVPVDRPAKRSRVDLAGRVRRMVAMDIGTGQEKWSFDDPLKHKSRQLPEPAASLLPMSFGEGKIFLQTSSYQCRAPDAMVAAVDAATGKELWRYTMPDGTEVKSRWSSTDSASRILVRDGKLIYVGGHSLGKVVVFDANTGNIIGNPKGPPGRVAYNGECSGSLATVNWLVMSGVIWWNKEINATMVPSSRSSCGTGSFPAQGMVFVNPAGCDCTSYTRGYIGLNTTPLGTPIADNQRLTKGASAVPAAKNLKGWTYFMGSPQRWGYTPDALPGGLKVQQSVSLTEPIAGILLEDRMRDEYWGGAVTGATIAEGKAVVGLPDANAIAAVDLANGKVAWRTSIGGPVDSPPTLYQGLAIVGSQDGHIYALRLDNGELVWKFNAAPHDRRAMLNGRLASAFPVPGSVLVLNDTVLATSGYHAFLGGIHSWALDPRTGAVKGCGSLLGNDQTPSPSQMVLNDILVATKDNSGGTVFRSYLVGLDGKPSEAIVPRSAKPDAGGAQRAASLDRRVAMIRYPHSANRGGSTHGWNNLMSIGGLSAFRIVSDGQETYRLSEIATPRPLPERTVALECNKADETRQNEPTWKLTNKDLENVEAYTAMIKAGDRLYLAGGSRNGKTGFVQVVSAGGKLLQSIALPSQVSASGLAAAEGKLVASCINGSVVILSQ